MSLLNIVNSPWALLPEKLDEIVGIYMTHLRGEKIDIAALEARLGGPLPGPVKGYTTIDGVAVLPLDGVLANRMTLLQKVSGGTSLEQFRTDFRTAMKDPAVHSVVLAVDSPGGSVMGLQEAANVVREARGIKPIIAVTDAMMASAAYWIGSAADQIFISSDMTLVGSIGVLFRHVDRSGANEKAGLRVSEVYAGKYKTLGSDDSPLSDEARADIKAKVDKLYALFVDTVALNRGVDSVVVRDKMAEGRVFLGEEAIAAGLVDGVATLDQVIEDLKAGRKPASTPRSRAGVASAQAFTQQAEETMSITKEFLLANHAALVEEFRAEGFKTGQAEGLKVGADAERGRILAIEAQAMPGHEQLIATLKADGKTSGEQAAVQILAAEKQKNAGALAQLRSEATKAAPATPSVDGDAAAKASREQAEAEAKLPLEERAKKQFERDPKLAAEFGTVERYTGWLKHEEKRKAA